MTGWYGKIPVVGDFICRRLPPAFRQAWDHWLEETLPASRCRLGTHWRERYLSMPVWRFVLSGGVLTDNAWAGILAPSVDAVGRHFPLTIATSLCSASLDVTATLLAAKRWFDDVETVALSAIGPAANVAAVDAQLRQVAFRSEWLQHARPKKSDVAIRGAEAKMACIALAATLDDERPAALVRKLAGELHQTRAAWLAEPSELFGRTMLLCESLPNAEQFCAMMDGSWLEHGWSLR